MFRVCPRITIKKEEEKMRRPNLKTMVLRSDTRKLAESNQKSKKWDGKPFNKRKMAPMMSSKRCCCRAREDVRKNQKTCAYFYCKMVPRMSSKRCSCRGREDVRNDRKEYFLSDLDILWEILCRLPIEALLRCQCVCKTWYSVTKNPVFISMHMNISSKQLPRFICRYVPLFNTPIRSENHLLLLDTEDVKQARQERWDPKDGKARKMPIEENWNKFRRIIFSHNGLLCIATSSISRGDPIVICNPITKERIKLPPTHDAKHVFSPQVGFCFVPERQKHIVVLAFSTVTRTKSSSCPGLDQPINFYIMTSGQRSWRLLTSSPSINHKTHMLGDTVYWNSAFHWRLIRFNGGPVLECIISFDTIRETFQIISFPNVHHGRCVELLVLNGRLSLILKHSVKMEVWEVTGDKVGEFSLVCRETYDIGCNDFYLVSRLPKNGNLLVRYHPCLVRSGFVVASNDLKQYEDLKIDGLPSNFHVSFYSPSLVSVHSMGFT